MKDHTFDARIIAAAPPSDKTNSFVKDVMKKISQQSLTGTLPRKRRGFVAWFTHLHKPAIALAAFVAVVLLGGAVYAAVHFAPALIQLLGKETNQRGATEYSVAGFADCAGNHTPALQRAEIKKDANLSDEEVRKILQAKCELLWLQDFPGKKWPPYGTNAEWKDGDTIYYTRIDMLGKYQDGTETYANINLGDNLVKFTSPQGEKITAFAAGEEISLADIKPGDTVFTISRISETYRDMSKYMSGAKDTLNPRIEIPRSEPKVIGLVALFKMSLPYEYYMEKQQFVTEVPECFGNPGELCPSTASVDVYPRSGGEGAQNPYMRPYNETDVSRQISGTVTELSDDTLTLTSRSGKLYTITVGDAGFKDYNQNHTKAYGETDVTLRVGSTVQVMYVQPKDGDPTKVGKDQVRLVALQLDTINPKKGNIKQY